MDEKSLLLAMKRPVWIAFSRAACVSPPDSTVGSVSQLSRQIFDAAVQWAMKADSKTQFWRSHRSAKTESPRESMATVRQAGGVASRARSDEYVYSCFAVCGWHHTLESLNHDVKQGRGADIEAPAVRHEFDRGS